jgi:hypothetical protein
MRAAPGVSAQRINIAFDIAQPLQDAASSKTMLSDEKAVQLWDGVVNSIRPAPRCGWPVTAGGAPLTCSLSVAPSLK